MGKSLKFLCLCNHGFVWCHMHYLALLRWSSTFNMRCHRRGDSHETCGTLIDAKWTWNWWGRYNNYFTSGFHRLKIERRREKEERGKLYLYLTFSIWREFVFRWSPSNEPVEWKNLQDCGTRTLKIISRKNPCTRTITQCTCWNNDPYGIRELKYSWCMFLCLLAELLKKCKRKSVVEKRVIEGNTSTKCEQVLWYLWNKRPRFERTCLQFKRERIKK